MPVDPALEKSEPEKPKQGTFIGASANLMASSMGAGILALPKALWLSGAVLGTVLLAIFGISSALSLIFLTASARTTGAYGFEALGKRLYGVCGQTAVRLALLFLLCGAFVIIIIVIGDLATPLWCQWAANGTFVVQLGECSADSLRWPHLRFLFGRVFVTCAMVLIPFGLSLARDLGTLRYSSTLAVLAVVYVCVALCFKLAQKQINDRTFKMGEGVASATTSPINLVLSFPIQFLAFCCQFTVLPLAASMRGGDGEERKRCCGMRTIDCAIIFSITSVFIIYAMFGLVGYLYFGADVQHYDNILNGFPSHLGPDTDYIMTAGSICILFTNVLKLPLLALPLRATFNNIIPALRKRSGAGGGLRNWGLHLLETFLLFALWTTVAIVCRELDVAFQFLGSTAGVAVCFVLPGLFFYRMTTLMRVDPMSEALLKPDGLEMQLAASENDRVNYGRCCWAGIAMVVFGAITGVITFAASVYQVVAPHV